MISQGEERVDDLSGFGNLQAASCHAGSLHQQDIFLLSQVCIEVSIPSGREREHALCASGRLKIGG